MNYKQREHPQLLAEVITEKYNKSIHVMIYFLVKGRPVSQAIVSAFRVYT